MLTKTENRPAAWANFISGDWENGVNVRDFIQKNYTPYEGDRQLPCSPLPPLPPNCGTA